MDKIIIKGLELFGFHGVNQEEKNMGQKFVLDMVLSLDLTQALRADNIDATVNYASVCHQLKEVFLSQKYDLIERAAYELALTVLKTYDIVSGVKVLLKKPWAPVLLPLEYPAVEIEVKRHTAYIAVGSNLGDKHANIQEAYALIEASDHTRILKKSTLIETEPVGYEDQDTFVNGVFCVETFLSPQSLMAFLLSVEADLKRERLIRWGPRTLDLDIIYYDQLISEEDPVIVPHPRMHEREFVLKPLAEIAPYKVHPLYHKRTIELLEALNH